MSSSTVNNIQNGAIVVANDLRTGMTVCLGNNHRWSVNWQEAWVITNDLAANSAMEFAAKSIANNDVIDAYLVYINADGEPSHTRERLRKTGPSVDYLSNSKTKSETSDHVSIR